MTKRTKDKAVEARRAFLKGASLAGVAVAINAATTDEAKAKDTQTEKASGYRETEHINAYYKAAKF